MRPIHKQSDGSFLFAVATVLFLAVCAWGGAELYARFRPRAVPAAAEGEPELLRTSALTGVVLRCEEPLCLPFSAALEAADGARIPAGGTLARLSDGTALLAERSCLFFSEADGLEGLSVPDVLDVAALRALLEQAPDLPEDCRGRLVYGEAWYYAALAPAGTAAPSPGPCRVRFAGREEWLSARLLSASAADGGQRALLLRLNRGGDYLSLRHCDAVLYLPATVS